MPTAVRLRAVTRKLIEEYRVSIYDKSHDKKLSL